MCVRVCWRRPRSGGRVLAPMGTTSTGRPPTASPILMVAALFIPTLSGSRRLRCSGGTCLIEDLVEDDAGGNGQVERIASAYHWDTHHQVTDCLLLGRESFAFAPHQQYQWSRIACGAIVGGGSAGSADDEHSFLLFPARELLETGLDKPLREDRAHAGTQRAGVIRVGAVTEQY